jgi:hypothetical protein
MQIVCKCITIYKYNSDFDTELTVAGLLPKTGKRWQPRLLVSKKHLYGLNKHNVEKVATRVRELAHETVIGGSKGAKKNTCIKVVFPILRKFLRSHLQTTLKDCGIDVAVG